LRLLVLGGTHFVGRHMVEAALARGDEVTIFHRGKTNPRLFADAEHVLGDREHDLERLRGRTWDAVIDTCAYVPRVARISAEALESSVDRYAFISSVSVYPDETTPGQDESSPVSEMDDPTIEEVTDTTYGPLKVLCERAVERVFGDRSVVVRPTYVVGPFDHSDRFTYWLHRAARGGAMLAPEPLDLPIQIIDARDLADWALRLIDAGATGPHNALGPAESLHMQQVIDTAIDVAAAGTEAVWIPQQFLLDHGIEVETDLPLWAPGPDYAGYMTFNPSNAIAAGLTYRPLKQTITDTLNWDATLPPNRKLEAGITRQREQDLLQAWQSSN
jgi:2'-hydroxyisoflavone reductase